MRYEEFLNQVMDKYAKTGLLLPDEMPEVELYMDQVVSLLNKELAVYKEKEQDVFTKSMVSNYVKHKVLPKPENKKYNKEHMVILNMIFQLKSIFQMDEMKVLFKSFVENHESILEEQYDMEGLYDSLLRSRDKEILQMTNHIHEDIEYVKAVMEEMGTSDDDVHEIMGVILILAIQSNAYRLMARKLLNEYFIDNKKKSERKKYKKRLLPILR